MARALLERFERSEPARPLMAEFGVDRAWQAYVQLRLRIVEGMLADPEVIRCNQWPHNMALLQAARRECPHVALATRSHCPQVRRVLGILNLTDAFDFVAGRDDVERGNPDPEIYTLVTGELSVSPAECLLLEDSPTGVKAGLAAGMSVIAVSTPFCPRAAARIRAAAGGADRR